jgi:ABC-type transporter Mla MlaB component
MWKVKREQNGNGIVLRLIGRLEGDQLTELKQVLASDLAIQGLTLDLSDVRLVDQGTVLFLADCEARGARLQNCPDYIREWIEAANKDEESSLNQN